MKRILLISLITAVLSGCQTTYNASRPTPSDVRPPEETIVFVRPDKYSIIGTRSIRAYLEIVYEKTLRNSADLLRVSVGFRNKGGQVIYDLKSPDFSVSVKTTYYAEPIGPDGPQGPPVYETNWETIPMTRGSISHYESICPVPQGLYYQITVSEELSN